MHVEDSEIILSLMKKKNFYIHSHSKEIHKSQHMASYRTVYTAQTQAVSDCSPGPTQFPSAVSQRSIFGQGLS